MNTILLLLGCGLFMGDGSITAEQLAAKHLKAIGGDKWSEVKTLKITGDYESFSDSHPFTIYRKRPDLYRFEHRMIRFDVIACYDGEQAWWINHMMPGGEKAQPIFKPQNNITVRESVFDNALFGYKEKGHTLKYLGMEEMEGDKHHKLEVALKDGPTEIWWIHSKTFLRTFMETDGYEYGRKAPMEVFFGDYRKVNGVMMPFFIEQEWHTRHRVFNINKIEANVAIDEKIFAMPTE